MKVNPTDSDARHPESTSVIRRLWSLPSRPRNVDTNKEHENARRLAVKSRHDLRLSAMQQDSNLERSHLPNLNGFAPPLPQQKPRRKLRHSTSPPRVLIEEVDKKTIPFQRFQLPKSEIGIPSPHNSPEPGLRMSGAFRASSLPILENKENRKRSASVRASSGQSTGKAPSRLVTTGEGKDGQPCILIGIDFGTTYSGVAWAYSKQPEDIKIVTNWDSYQCLNSDKGKAPTEISYKPDSAIDHNYTIKWGYGIGDTEAVKWFKLLLLDKEEMGTQQWNSPQIKRARLLLQRACKSPIEAVADYLRFLWRHAIMNIEKEFGEIQVNALPFRVVLTVPAVWTTKAVNKMGEAAEQAGIMDLRLAGPTTLNFVSEPEAAALATFDDLKHRPNFKKDDTFVVCDAGGGTVDLISYKVHQAHPMQLKECVEGKGSLCGAVFLDQDFEALMEQFVGDAWKKAPDLAIKEMMNVQWENGIKRGFAGQERSWKVTLPYECVELGAPPVLHLDRGYVGEIFDNVASQVRALVNDQISAVGSKEGKLPKAVVLVGGFGSCRYLFNLLYKENMSRGIEVYQSTGNKPWTAVCRGAVLKALTNSNLPGVTVNSRILRHSYGIMHSTNFDKDLHLESEKYLDPVTGKYKARNQLTWYLLRGDNIEEASSITMPWLREIPTLRLGSLYTLQENIYNCDSSTPPSRLNPQVRSNYYVESVLDISDTTTIQGVDKKEYKKLEFQVEMNVIGTALEFTLVFAGRRMGKCNVRVDFEGG